MTTLLEFRGKCEQESREPVKQRKRASVAKEKSQQHCNVRGLHSRCYSAPDAFGNTTAASNIISYSLWPLSE